MEEVLKKLYIIKELILESRLDEADELLKQVEPRIIDEHQNNESMMETLRVVKMVIDNRNEQAISIAYRYMTSIILNFK